MNEPVAWKAYEEVHFSDQYILRWVREGDEYVNKITKEMMEDLKSVVRQQQAEIEALKARVEEVKATNGQLVELVQLHREDAEKMRNEILAWENAEVPVEVMADIIVELEKRGFIEKAEK